MSAEYRKTGGIHIVGKALALVVDIHMLMGTRILRASVALVRAPLPFVLLQEPND